MIVVVSCPLIGYLSDRSGKRGYVLVVALLLLTSSHAAMAGINSCKSSD